MLSPERTSLEINGMFVPLDAFGKATVELTADGTYTAVARATDMAGNEGSDALAFDVLDLHELWV